MKKLKIFLIFFLLMNIMVCMSIATEGGEASTEATPDSSMEQEDQSEENESILEGEDDVQEHTPTYENTIGRVLQIKENKEVETGIGKQKVQVVVIEITKGDYIGEEFTLDYTSSYDGENQIKSRELKEGDKVQVQITEGQDGKKSVIIQDVVKTKMIIILAILLVISIIALYGKRSIREIIMFVFTLFIVYFLLIQNVLNGANITLFSLLTSAVLIVGSNVIVFGINRNSFSSIVGNIVTIVIVGIITTISIGASGLSGLIEEAMQLNVSLSLVKFDLFSLIFAMSIMVITGISISVSISIVKGLEEIRKRESDINWKELFKSGLEIGKEEVKSRIIMIVLIFGNFVLTPILLFMTSYNSVFEVFNKEMVAESVIIALIAEIGLIISVPVVAISYSLINRDKVIYNKSSKNRMEGKRSLKL